MVLSGRWPATPDHDRRGYDAESSACVEAVGSTSWPHLVDSRCEHDAYLVIGGCCIGSGTRKTCAESHCQWWTNPVLWVF
jgi:hypothetical protein